MYTMKKLSSVIIAATLFSLPGMSMAHPEHDEAPQKVQQADLKAELSGAKTGATVRVTKDGKAVSTKGASGTLTLLGDKTTHLALKPVAGGAMTAQSKKAIGNGTRAKVMITFADKSILSTEVVAK